jgi:YD repeat-containing protein
MSAVHRELWLVRVPNALGQPTQVRDLSGANYASGVSYHPNGAIKRFTYGNGVVHTMTQNARQLPATSGSSGGVHSQQFGYDQNGNVTSAIDSLDGTRSRWMTYDGLDRLTGAGSVVFGGNHWHFFTYDAFDNMKSWKLAGVKDYANYVYDASNRLTNIQNSSGATVVGLSYDAQGNLQNKNGRTYDFDYGNRLRVATEQWCRYDGHGGRMIRPTQVCS